MADAPFVGAGVVNPASPFPNRGTDPQINPLRYNTHELKRLSRDLDMYFRADVDIRLFGAKTGGFDCTTAIQRAVEWATPRGRRVYIPPGTWWCRAVPVTVAGTQIIGVGDTSILKRLATGSERVLWVSASNVTIEQLLIDGNSAGGGTVGAAAVDVTPNNTGFSMHRVSVINAVGFGVRVINGSQVILDHVTVINSVRTGIVMQAVFAGDTSDIEVSYCTVDRSSLAPDTASWHGILIRGSDAAGVRWCRNVKLIGNTCHQPYGSTLGIGIECWGAEVSLLGNICTGGCMGISTGVNGSNVAIAGNVCRDNTFIGIELIAANVPNLAYAGNCTGNIVDGGGVCEVGISTSTTDGPDHVNITGNTVYNFTQYGIHMLGPRHSKVEGNELWWDPTLGAGNRIAIFFQSVGRDSGLRARISCNTNTIVATATHAASFGVAVGNASASGDPDFSIVAGLNTITGVAFGVSLTLNGAGLVGVGNVSLNHIEASTTDVVKNALNGATLTGVIESNNT